jgi:lincosamide nucleotidyltransferase A/C/D/E
MPDHVMSESDAPVDLGAIAAGGIDVCVGGGWGVDALLGEQTRVHADLDLWLAADSFDGAVEAFVALGVDRLYPWGNDRPWNFVLHDGAHRRVDLHIHEITLAGDLHYGAFEAGETFPAAALQGSGRIGDRSVRCDAAEWSLRWHTGYPPRDEDRLDVAALCQRFGYALPPDFR